MTRGPGRDAVSFGARRPRLSVIIGHTPQECALRALLREDGYSAKLSHDQTEKVRGVAMLALPDTVGRGFSDQCAE